LKQITILVLLKVRFGK